MICMIINVFFFLYNGFNMINSSSFNHHDVASEPLENDLLWMQKNHIHDIFGMMLMKGV